jgi:asparagine synthase (glutamine-hydrolysing)
VSGLAGIWNLDGRPVGRQLLVEMSTRLAHRGGDGEGYWIAGPVGLASQLRRLTPESLREQQPLVDAAGRVLVFDGRLDNREELFAALPTAASLAAEAPDPELLLAAYGALGERLWERLTGDFALALYDAGRRELLLVRDRLGVRSLYYYHTGALFLFASEIKPILAHPDVRTRPSELDLADFLLADSPLHHQGVTFFESIRHVPPAHLLRVTPEKQELRRYWDFPVERRLRFRQRGEYAEAFRHYFERAVRRRLRSAYPVAVSVSGGLDSSSVFCVAERLRSAGAVPQVPLYGFTFDTPTGTIADEMMYVEAIEREYGVRIERVPVCWGMLDGDARAMDAVRELVTATEMPFLDEQLATSRRLYAAIRARGARVLLTGHWGDQMLFASSYLVELVRRFRWLRVVRHLREYTRWLTDTDPRALWQRFLMDLVKYHTPASALPLLRRIRRKLLGRTRDCAWYADWFRELAARGVYRNPHDGKRFASLHARALYEDARARYYVLSLEWNDKVGAAEGLQMAFPFLDPELLSFLMAIPGEVPTAGGVPKALLREAMCGILPEEIRGRTWKADFTMFIREGLQQDLPILIRHLRQDRLLHSFGYVDEARLEAMLAALEASGLHPGDPEGAQLCNLIGLSVWLHRFFGGERAARRETAPREPATQCA